MKGAKLFFFLAAVLFFQPAFAGINCGCAEESFDRRWEKADAVFIGTVKEVKVAESFTRYKEADLPVEVTLSIDTPYKKGEEGDEKTFVIHTSLTHYTCTGFPFEKDQKYLVFAYQRRAYDYIPQSLYKFPSGSYDVGGFCGGTKEFVKAESDLQDIAATLKKDTKKDRGLIGKFLGK